MNHEAPPRPSRRLEGHGLLWTVIAAVTVTAVAIASLVAVLAEDGGRSGEGPRPVDLGEPSFEGVDRLSWDEYEPGGTGEECYDAGVDFDAESKPLYDDPHELDDTIDADYHSCTQSVDSSLPDSFRLTLRSETEGQTKDYGGVDTAPSCYAAADAATKDSTREWYLESPAEESTRPKRDTFCLFTPDHLVRMRCIGFGRSGDSAAGATIEVTMWRLP